MKKLLVAVALLLLAGCSSSGARYDENAPVHKSSNDADVQKLTVTQYVITAPEDYQNIILSCAKGVGIYSGGSEGGVAVLKDDPNCRVGP